jgi:hypothetical protein
MGLSGQVAINESFEFLARLGAAVWFAAAFVEQTGVPPFTL